MPSIWISYERFQIVELQLVFKSFVPNAMKPYDLICILYNIAYYQLPSCIILPYYWLNWVANLSAHTGLHNYWVYLCEYWDYRAINNILKTHILRNKQTNQNQTKTKKKLYIFKQTTKYICTV